MLGPVLSPQVYRQSKVQSFFRIIPTGEISMNGKLRLVLDTAHITHIEIKSFQSCGFQMTWLGVICGMKEGTGWGATRALFAALDVD